ncbi:MAG: site-specific integrase [Salinarimonadaceae bacterium]|nr:MAG: site-specific integrase [Salinarimonadaceae bacterium]
MTRRIDPSRRRPPPQEWPARDREAWEAALRPAHPFGVGGQASQWRPLSQKKVAQAYGRWILFLREQDCLCDDEGPAERASRDRLRAYHAHLVGQDLATVTIAGLFTDLREALRVMRPGTDLAVLDRAIAVLQANAMPTRDKTRTYVRPAELLRATQAHLAELALDASRHQPARIRTGLQLLFLILRPIRRENFIRLRLGDDIIRSGAGGWRLRLPPEKTKNHAPFEVELPELLGCWLDRYLAEWRPALLDGRASDRLWITHMGTEMTGDGLYGELRKLTQKLFRKSINPHALRDGPATALAIEDPTHVGAASPMLGHRSSRMAEKHYNQARTLEAAEAWQDALSRRRRVSSRDKAPRMPR